MAWDYDGEWILCVCGCDGAGCGGLVKALGDLCIGYGFSAWNRAENVPHAMLEFCALRI